MATYYTNRAVRQSGNRPDMTGYAPVDIDVVIGDVVAAGPAADDVINLRRFSNGAHIKKDTFSLLVTNDIDSNGSPTLQWDLQVADNIDGTNDDGSAATVLISNSTARADTDTDALDTAIADFVDVGGKYLQMKIDTAAATFGATGSLGLVFDITLRGEASQPYNIPGVSVTSGTI